MQKPKLVDNATPGLEFQDSSTSEALDGTIVRATFQNDNFGNLFKLVESAGYTLIDNDLSQVAKAVRGLYNATFTYNTSAIATQTVDDIVLGSDGVYYKALEDGINDDDPVGSVTGDWEVYQDINSKLSDVVDDTTPQLGGDLDFNGKTANKSAVRQIEDATLGTGTHTFDYENGDMQQLTVTGNITLAFINFPSGDVGGGSIQLINAGAYIISYPSGTEFVMKEEPIFTASGMDEILVRQDKDDVVSLFVVGQDIGVPA